MVNVIPPEWLPVRCETNRPAETVERVRDTIVRSPQKSHRASRELQMRQSSVWLLLRKRLRVRGYELQLLAGVESPGSKS